MPHSALAAFPVVIEADVAWGEMDSYGHVNNVVYFRYFENARVELLSLVGWFELKDTLGMGPIVASASAKFRKPLKYPDRIAIGARIAEIQPDRITVEHAIYSTTWDAIAAEGPAVVVNYDYGKSAKAPLPEGLRAAIMALSAT
jgi:acyl-CoA thioester hydrolase